MTKWRGSVNLQGCHFGIGGIAPEIGGISTQIGGIISSTNWKKNDCALTEKQLK
ncbi:hypothetical protein [Neobacillus sp. NPDC093127]|uniref:hypothetical protein n=1 Tax=Neobacillus sp. NPDC093127 TaxID=3364296 RepID=UPI0037F867B4